MKKTKLFSKAVGALTPPLSQREREVIFLHRENKDYRTFRVANLAVFTGLVMGFVGLKLGL
ncbi:MAG: hypothetical protein CSA83_02215, partial [Actinomycetales bacterium]